MSSWTPLSTGARALHGGVHPGLLELRQLQRGDGQSRARCPAAAASDRAPWVRSRAGAAVTAAQAADGSESCPSCDTATVCVELQRQSDRGDALCVQYYPKRRPSMHRPCVVDVCGPGR